MDENNMQQENCRTYTFGNSSAVDTSVKAGISFGSALAMIVSYTAWQSIPWAILHGLMSWAYVIYYAVKY